MALIRQATGADMGPLARLWHSGWQDAHADILPQELARHRTLASFRERLEDGRDDLLVSGPEGAPLGFVMLKGDELYQMYLTADARGAGLAAKLMRAAEDRLCAGGITTAWLACAIGNDRAARFYEKSGWRRTGVITSRLEVPGGIFSLDVWRFEKTLAP